jgi:hypothetical protein
METDIHPLDFEALQKGDVIEQSTIEKAYAIRHDDDPDGYRVQGQLRLRAEILSHRGDLLVRTKGRGLVVLTDEQAEEYTVSRHAQLVGATLRNTSTRARIDRSGFDELQQRKAESWDRAMTAQAMDARKSLRAERRRQLLLGNGDSQ